MEHGTADGFAWKLMNYQGLKDFQGFQQRNKLTVEYLISEKERELLKQQAKLDQTSSALLYGLDLDKTQRDFKLEEGDDNIEEMDEVPGLDELSTSAFIQGLVEKLTIKNQPRRN